MQKEHKSKGLIFLDIDGVMVTPPFSDDCMDEYGHLFNENSVNNLRELIEFTGFDIVICSAWYILGLDKLQEMWIVRQLPGKVVGVAPTTHKNEKHWKSGCVSRYYNSLKVSLPYIIICDDYKTVNEYNYNNTHRNYLVEVSSDKGFNDECLIRAKRIYDKIKYGVSR